VSDSKQQYQNPPKNKKQSKNSSVLSVVKVKPYGFLKKSPPEKGSIFSKNLDNTQNRTGDGFLFLFFPFFSCSFKI
jgi:hypothetical protein